LLYYSFTKNSFTIGNTNCRCSSGVEHFLGKEEVESSILFNGSTFLDCFARYVYLLSD
jgi:hypothetical protein